MVSYTVKQTVVENLNADLDGKQPAGDYPTNASLTESLQSNLLNYTTNRILEIPQDIKLELNNGTLTLKAGSKVYIPNGFESDGTTPKFDVFIVSKDVLLSASLVSNYYTSGYGWCFNKNLNKIQGGNFIGNQFQSGTFVQTVCCMFYDTAANIIRYTADTGATWEEGYSLPFAVTQLVHGTGITSIDQVFNGFGYIGSTEFALPGVKYQFAVGTDNNGLFSSVVKTSNTVTIRNNLTTETGEAVCFLTEDFQPYAVWQNNYHTSATQPDDQTGAVWFNGNVFYQNIGTNDSPNWKQKNLIPCFNYSVNQGTVTQFKGYEVSKFNSYQDFELAEKPLPSNNFINLTLGASGTIYTVPANGWINMSVNLAVNNYMAFFNKNSANVSELINMQSAGINQNYTIGFPIRAGQKFRVQYDAYNNLNSFRFYFAQGEL